MQARRCEDCQLAIELCVCDEKIPVLPPPRPLDRWDRYLLLDDLQRRLMYMRFPKLGLVHLPLLQQEISEELEKLKKSRDVST